MKATTLCTQSLAILAAFVGSTATIAEALYSSPSHSVVSGSVLSYKGQVPPEKQHRSEGHQLRSEDLLNYSELTVPSLASDFHKSLLESDLQSRLEKNYFYELHSFLYFHGYETSSIDVDSRNKYNLDPKEEFKIRNKMAKSINTYFFSRALPRFLKTRDGTRSLGRFYEKSLKITHIKGRFSDEGRYSWKYSSGLNPLNLKVYMQLSNSLWRFAYEDNSFQEGTWASRFTFSRVIVPKIVGGVYYQSDSDSSHVFSNWKIRKNVKASIDSGVYLSPEKQADTHKTKIQVSYRF